MMAVTLLMSSSVFSADESGPWMEQQALPDCVCLCVIYSDGMTTQNVSMALQTSIIEGATLDGRQNEIKKKNKKRKKYILSQSRGLVCD